MSHMLNMYQDKSAGYFSSVRHEILPFLPRHAPRVLEIGCGTGATLAWLRSAGRVAESWGVELDATSAIAARDVIDHLVVGDVERDPIDFGADQFDLVLCLDVLEHLVDPWTMMARLRRWLSPGGVLVASIPNIRYYTVMRDLLLKGTFQYADAGILDRTHLRFFTRQSALELMKAGNLEHIEVSLHPGELSGLRRLFDRATLGNFRDVFAWQLLLRGQKPSRDVDGI